MIYRDVLRKISGERVKWNPVEPINAHDCRRTTMFRIHKPTLLRSCYNNICKLTAKDYFIEVEYFIEVTYKQRIPRINVCE